MTFMLLVGCASGLLMLYVCGTLAFIKHLKSYRL